MRISDIRWTRIDSVISCFIGEMDVDVVIRFTREEKAREAVRD